MVDDYEQYEEEDGSAWTKKGGTLSDKSARKEYGLTQEEIVEAIKAGKLQYRYNNVAHMGFRVKRLPFALAGSVTRRFGA